MNNYHFEVVEVEDVFLFSEAYNVSAELTTIADELQESQNLKHVRFTTLHEFRRII